MLDPIPSRVEPMLRKTAPSGASALGLAILERLETFRLADLNLKPEGGKREKEERQKQARQLVQQELFVIQAL